MENKPLTKVLICGKRCTGKTTLFWDLQKRMNWPIFSASQYLRDYIYRNGLSNNRGDIEKHHENLSHEIDERITNLFESGESVVVEARAYGEIKKPFSGVLKVLLIADDVCRYKRASNREGVAYPRAAKRVEKKDEEFMSRAGKVLGFYDFYDEKYYDLVIDTTNLTPEQVVDKVIEGLK